MAWPFQKPDFDELYWATGPDAEVEEPTTQRKLKGHELYKPPHGFFNWFWNAASEAMAWLRGGRYSSLGEALKDAEIGEVVPVGRHDNGVSSIGNWSDSSLGVSSQAICTDGRYVFSIEGLEVKAREVHESFDLALEWGTSGAVRPSASPNKPRSLACDGKNVYVGYESGAYLQPLLCILDAKTGAVLTSLVRSASSGTVQKIVSNGERYAFCYDHITEIRNVSDSGDRNVDDAGVDVTDLAIDSGLVYAISPARTNAPVGANITAWSTEFTGTNDGPPTSVWDLSPGTAVDPARIAADGLKVYVTFNQTGSANLYVYSRAGYEVINTQQPEARTLIAVDHRFVYTAAGGGGLSILEKQLLSGVGWVPSSELISVDALDCDGMKAILIGENSLGNPCFWQVDSGGQGFTRFYVADPTSPGRMPFYKAAVPLGGE